MSLIKITMKILFIYKAINLKEKREKLTEYRKTVFRKIYIVLKIFIIKEGKQT